MAKHTIGIFTFLVAFRRIGAMFTMGIYSIYLREHGLSLLEINLVNSIYFGTMLLFELPTGAIADVFGRRKAFLCSSLLVAAGFISYGCSSTMKGFMFSEALVAIGSTFENGTFKAWLVDRLHHFGHKDEDLSKIFSRAGRIGLGIGAISSIIGAKALTIWQPLPWLIGGSVFFASGVMAYFLMKEEYFVKNSRSFKENLVHSRKMVVEGFMSAYTNSNILFLFLLGLVSCVSLQALNMQWPILFKPVVGGNVRVGFLGALISLSLALGTALAPRIKERFAREKDALIWTQIFTGICIVLSIVLLKPYLVIPAYFLHEVFRGAYQPMKDCFLQHSINEKERRATISSFESISNHIGAIAGLLFSGFLAEARSIQSTWIASGLFMILGTLAVARMYRK